MNFKNNLAVRVIPCLDVDKGRVVKGVNFVDIKDAGDPVEIAINYNREGADELVFLDITASSDNRDTTINMIAMIAEHLFIPFTVGGGIRQLSDVRKLLNAGADKVSINSAAIRDPNLILDCTEKFGSQCIVLAIDAKKSQQGFWEVYSQGGRQPTGIDAVEWAQQKEAEGAGEILLTSMDHDGTKSGFNLELTKTISTAVSIPVIASGGVGTLQHLVDGVKIGKADAVLAASIFHFGEYSIQEAKVYMQQHDIPVR